MCPECNFALATRPEQFGDIQLWSKRLRALSGSLLKERQRIRRKEKSEGADKGGFVGRGGKVPSCLSEFEQVQN